MMPQPDRMILFAAFVSGACSLLVELAGVRVLAPYLGTTIYSWAAVIGFVLASLSLGYYAGGSLSDRFSERKHLSAALLAAGLMTLSIPFLAASILPFTLFLDIVPASLLGAAILAPASCFYGMVSPYAIKLTSETGAEGRGAGRVFAVSTLGSIAGALGTGFVLIPNLAISHIFILAALLMLLSSVIVAGWRKERLPEMLPFALMAFALYGVQLDPAFIGDTIYRDESAYYHIRILDTAWNGAPARVLFLDNAPSTGERGDGSPAFTYVQMTNGLYPAAGDVQEALVIGAGGGTEIESIKDAFPDAHVTGLEIDPEVAYLGSRYFSLSDDARTDIVIEDARRFIRKADAAYDLVVIDVFRGASPPYHLATREFLLELKSRMAPDGVVMVNIISSFEGGDSGAFRAFYSTYSSAFENVIAVPTEGGPAAMQNIILIAGDKDLSGFEEMGSGIYSAPVSPHPPLTDENNPIELYAAR